MLSQCRLLLFLRKKCRSSVTHERALSLTALIIKKIECIVTQIQDYLHHVSYCCHLSDLIYCILILRLKHRSRKISSICLVQCVDSSISSIHEVTEHLLLPLILLDMSMLILC